MIKVRRTGASQAAYAVIARYTRAEAPLSAKRIIANDG
jgi:hypothetical protein